MVQETIRIYTQNIDGVTPEKLNDGGSFLLKKKAQDVTNCHPLSTITENGRYQRIVTNGDVELTLGNYAPLSGASGQKFQCQILKKVGSAYTVLHSIRFDQSPNLVDDYSDSYYAWPVGWDSSAEKFIILANRHSTTLTSVITVDPVDGSYVVVEVDFGGNIGDFSTSFVMGEDNKPYYILPNASQGLIRSINLRDLTIQSYPVSSPVGAIAGIGKVLIQSFPNSAAIEMRMFNPATGTFTSPWTLGAPTGHPFPTPSSLSATVHLSGTKFISAIKDFNNFQNSDWTMSVYDGETSVIWAIKKFTQIGMEPLRNLFGAVNVGSDKVVLKFWKNNASPQNIIYQLSHSGNNIVVQYQSGFHSDTVTIPGGNWSSPGSNIAYNSTGNYLAGTSSVIDGGVQKAFVYTANATFVGRRDAGAAASIAGTAVNQFTVTVPAGPTLQAVYPALFIPAESSIENPKAISILATAFIGGTMSGTLPAHNTLISVSKSQASEDNNGRRLAAGQWSLVNIMSFDTLKDSCILSGPGKIYELTHELGGPIPPPPPPEGD